MRRLLSRLHLARLDRARGLRTAKLTVAAVLAFVVATWFETSADRVLAPLTALLVVQLTVYQTVAHVLTRVMSVLAGVLLAVGVAAVAGLTWWSLGAVVLASLIVGQLLRLGPHLMEVPISAMIVLAVGGSGDPATGRVYETVIGAGVGLLVNLVIAPPLHVRPAAESVRRLAGELADFLAKLAEELREGWSRGAADRWLDRARALVREVERADRDLGRAEESARFNPRGQQARAARPRLRTSLTALEHCQVALRNLCRSLLDRAYFVPEEEEHAAYTQEVREVLAAVLESTADALRSAGAFGAGGFDESYDAVNRSVAELQRRRDRLAEQLVVDPRHDQGAWQQHGALLAAVDRLKVEVEAAVRPPDEPWRPTPVTLRQRQAVRRAVARPRRRPPRRK